MAGYGTKITIKNASVQCHRARNTLKYEITEVSCKIKDLQEEH